MGHDGRGVWGVTGGACGAQKAGRDVGVTRGGVSDLSIDSFENADNGYADPTLAGPTVERTTFISSDMGRLHGGPSQSR